MKTVITLLIAGIFTSNLVTAHLLGIEGAGKEKKSLLAVFKSGAVITVLLTLFTTATYPLEKWVIEPLKIGYLSDLVFTLVIFGLLFILLFAAEKLLPKLSAFLKENCDMAAFVPVAMAVCLMNFSEKIITSYGIAVLYSVISGIGYMAVSLILFAANERIKTAELPEAVKGLPVTLIILSLISLAFGGFAGI